MLFLLRLGNPFADTEHSTRSFFFYQNSLCISPPHAQNTPQRNILNITKFIKYFILFNLTGIHLLLSFFFLFFTPLIRYIHTARRRNYPSDSDILNSLLLRFHSLTCGPFLRNQTWLWTLVLFHSLVCNLFLIILDCDLTQIATPRSLWCALPSAIYHFHPHLDTCMKKTL